MGPGACSRWLPAVRERGDADEKSASACSGEACDTLHNGPGAAVPIHQAGEEQCVGNRGRKRDPESWGLPRDLLPGCTRLQVALSVGHLLESLPGWDGAPRVS